MVTCTFIYSHPILIIQILPDKVTDNYITWYHMPKSKNYNVFFKTSFKHLTIKHVLKTIEVIPSKTRHKNSQSSIGNSIKNEVPFPSSLEHVILPLRSPETKL